MKKILEAFTKLLTVGYLLFFALGGIVVLRYCLSIDYYPSGVGIGDSLFFISAAIMFFVVYGFYFGLIYGLSVLLISMVRVPFNRVSSFVKVRFNKSALQIKKIDSLLYRAAYFTVGLIALSIYLLILFSGNQDFARAIEWSILCVSLGLFFLLLYSEDIEPHIDVKTWGFETPDERRKGIAKISFILFMLLSPLVITGSFIHLSEATITSMGISKKADLYLDKITAPRFQGVGEVKNDYLMLKDVNVLWTGVGSETVIEVNVNDKIRKYVLKTNKLSYSY